MKTTEEKKTTGGLVQQHACASGLEVQNEMYEFFLYFCHWVQGLFPMPACTSTRNVGCNVNTTQHHESFEYLWTMERLYLDTSVFGGHFEPEFELWTKVLFEKITQGQYKLLYSRLTDIELTRAPQDVRRLAVSIPDKHMEFIEISPDAELLADAYINEKVVSEISRADCLHIALATLNNADILVSWNFKHIVNINRIRGYNAVNYRHGHKMLEIRTPREILEL